jgi:hypothetical protein
MLGMILGGVAQLLAVGSAGAQVAAVDPTATGLSPAAQRVLKVDADSVQGQHILSEPGGPTQLLFRYGSTMTMAPGADLTIDSFTYNRDAKTAALAMTTDVGTFRFVGGRASNDSSVILNTPTAMIEISGGINFTAVEPNGDTETSQAYGRSTSRPRKRPVSARCWSRAASRSGSNPTSRS